MTVLADLSNLPPIDQQRGGDPTLLADELLFTIRQAIAAAPRSLQERVGPSEIGTPCDRRLGYKLANTAPVHGTCGWKATVGTAVHDWLAETFVMANAGIHPARWLVEHKVQVGSIDGVTIDGATDLYDRVTATVVDWKTTSRSRLVAYAKQGDPGEQYRIQAHLYARGWAARGLPVDTVAVMFLPRDDDLASAYWWSEPYDETVAVSALDRASSLAAAIRVAGADTVLPTLPTADAFCSYCPWFAYGATDLTRSCPGDPASRAAAPDALHNLIAPSAGNHEKEKSA